MPLFCLAILWLLANSYHVVTYYSYITLLQFVVCFYPQEIAAYHFAYITPQYVGQIDFCTYTLCSYLFAQYKYS